MTEGRSGRRRPGSSLDVRKNWDATYRSTSFDDLPWFRREATPWIARALRERWIDRKGVHLDVGCGAGSNVLWLASQGLRAVGTDLAPGAVRAASDRRARLPRARKALFVVGDALELPFEEATFSSSSDIGCFHTLPPERRKDYARELSRVLKPGGRHLLSWAARESTEALGPPHRLSVQEVVEAMEEHFVCLRLEHGRFPLPQKGRRSYSAVLERRSEPQPPPR